MDARAPYTTTTMARDAKARGGSRFPARWVGWVPGALALGALGALALGAGCAGGPREAGRGLTEQGQPVAVETVEARERHLPRTTQVSGALVGQRETRLASSGAGRVVRAAVERGDVVKAGQLLVELDTRAASLSAAEAQAALLSLETRQAQAKVDCARVEDLERQGVIPAAQAEQTRLLCATAPADRAMARARAGLAGVQVSHGRVLAPFSGAVTERLVNVGEYALPGTPLVSLVDLDRLRLEVAVPEALLGALPEGAELGFRTAAYPGRIFRGKLRGRGSRVRAASRDVLVDADVDNPDRTLLPGMFATVDLPLAPTPAVSLPVEALFERDGRWRVLELREGRLLEHVVQVGAESEGYRAVLQGLGVGVEVVRRPAGLRNGQAATRMGG